MNILATDTAFGRLSVCAYSNSETLSILSENNKEAQAERLFTLIEDCIKNASRKISKNDFDYFSACIGPGSYTGIRIGLTALRTIAYSLQKKFAGVTSLEALAWCAHKKTGHKNISALIYANKSEGYFQNFENISTNSLIWLNTTKAMVINTSEIKNHIGNNTLLVTDSDEIITMLNNNHEKINLHQEKIYYDAGDIAGISEILIKNKASLEERNSALYIKNPNAIISN